MAAPGTMWSFERAGIVPDFVTLGKPMGNGHPVAAVITRSEILARLGGHTTLFSTFGGNRSARLPRSRYWTFWTTSACSSECVKRGGRFVSRWLTWPSATKRSATCGASAWPGVLS
jgi:4-aminobutyrate aminotransferase-like enzyme